MSVTAKRIVFAIFTLLALSFIATTVALYVEFKDDQWFTIAAFYSHLFIFFPTFGILALFAFYIPAAALLDLYMHHVKRGPLRFAIGTLVLIGISMWLSTILITGAPAVWWLSPKTLASDMGRPEGCTSPRCTRIPIMDSVAEVRRISQQRTGLSPFVRPCETDQYTEVPQEQLHRRYCFVTKTKLTAAECCVAQAKFTSDITRLYEDEKEHALAGKIHAMLLPLKIFFLLMVLAIGILLAVWRRRIDNHYAEYTGRIERGLLVGAVAMLIWPISNHGFLQSSTLLYGVAGEGLYAVISPLMSFMFAAWALLLVLFFFRQHQRDVEAAGKIGGAIASAIAFVKYNEIIDFATRFIGSGADPLELALMAVILIVAFSALYIGLPVDAARKPQLEGPVPPPASIL
jgi:hypothetical protein